MNGQFAPRVEQSHFCVGASVDCYQAVLLLILAEAGQFSSSRFRSSAKKICGFPMWYAHSLGESPKTLWQPLSAHLTAVSDLSAKRGSKFGAQRAAALAGLLHDLGKYTREFQARLEGGERVDHATAGAREIMELAKRPNDCCIAEIVAHAIAGHHAGLPDSVGVGDASLAARLKRRLPPLDPIWREEISPVAESLTPAFFGQCKDKDKLPYQMAFFGRMLFSSLVDADFRDTEAFYAAAKGETIARDWPHLPKIVEGLIAQFDLHMTEKRASAQETQINALRDEILEHVRSRARESRGLFTLSVPTGGGKTLASLAFALEHAKLHGLERIVYAIPFTSIIDQTAAIFREVLGDDVVLEHHSSIDEGRLSAREAGEKLRLAMEDWAAPVVVTTNVQLFESLHSNRPSRCRRLHNLANAVIILDEAQTIPLHVLRPCLSALDELARNYGTSIVLCTATQPAVAAPDFPCGLALGPERELAPDPPRLHEKLKRVRLEHLGERTDDELIAALAGEGQGLVIVNSRAHALALYRKAKDAGLDGVVHLTTRQHAAHRRRILEDVRARLRSDAPCRLIATSLVEAGVDLDFPRVWRAEAGLDQIAQAAGRCNREGRRSIEESVVSVFRSTEHNTPREIAQLAGDMGRMMGKHADLLSPDAMCDYFGEVYWRKGDALDKHKVLEAWRISRSPRGTHMAPSFDYRTVAENFRMIESGLAPVIVAIEKPAQDALAALRGGLPPGAAARRLQSYIVQVPPKARDLLVRNGHVVFEKQFGDQFAVLGTVSLYSGEVGLLWEDADYLGAEQLLC
jgi:CRISPR-associated endonuclease/helicase Cas3